MMETCADNFFLAFDEIHTSLDPSVFPALFFMFGFHEKSISVTIKLSGGVALRCQR